MNNVKLLKRERIISLLSVIFDYPLTIVEAPMGFGKTTAVRSFLESKKSRPIWITFMNSGESTAFFWEKFTSEIGRHYAEAGVKLSSLGFPSDTPQTARFLDIFENIDFKENTVLVIDDFHLSPDIRINDLLLQLVKEKPDKLHIVLITRDTTNIGFTELLAKGLCTVISQQRLKFTADEVRDYCRMTAVSISEADLKKINEYTDGWISLIYMILLGLENGIPVGMNNSMDALIEKVLFRAYREQIRNFLLKLSIMNEFSAKQAMYVTQEEKAGEILKKLHSENAFVYFDEARKTYRIHNVLLDFLRIKQSFTTEERRDLYNRLGEWHLGKNEFVTGYTCLNKAGAYEKILAHLNEPANIRNELTEFEGSFEMFDILPLEMLNKYPLAYLQHILVSILRGNAEIIEVCAKKLDKLKKTYESMENIDEAYRSRVLAETLIIKKFTIFNHIDMSSDINDEIIRLLNGRQSYILHRDNESTFGAPHLLYIFFRDQGSLRNIMQLVADKYVTYSSFANGSGTGSEHLARAEYALETGDWNNAELYSRKAIYKARTKTQTSIIICATFNLIRLYIIQEKIKEAVGMLKQLEKDISEVNNPIYNTTIEMCKGYVYACLGQSEKIPWWLQTGEMSEADLFYQGIAFSYIVYGKAVMLSRKYIELEILSESFREHFAVFSNQLGFIHNGIFEAVAKYRLYGMKEGAVSLQAVLAKGQADNIVMPFAENAPYITDMLKQIANSNSGNVYFRKVLSCCEQYSKSLRSGQPGKVRLSQRETEVLSLAAEGLSRKEIAARMVVSQGTVKTHLQNIYQKLEISGKVSAIKTAKIHGLI